jgi:ABC-type multidrug transport system fused ATPase/permease subunit
VRYFFRAIKLMRPYAGLLAVYMLCTTLAAFFNAAPLILGKAYFEHLQNRGVSEVDLLKKSESILKKPGTTDTFRWMENAFHRAESALVAWIGDDPYTYLYGICAFIIVCVIFKGLFDFLVSYISAWVAQRLQVDAVERLMNHLLILDIGFHDRRKMGDLVSRMVGDTNCLRITAKLALEFISKPPEILVLVFMAIMWSWKLFLIGAIGLPLVIGPLMTFTRRIYKHAMRARVQAADMSQDMLQDLTGMRTVHAYEAAQAEGKNFNVLAEKFFRSSMRMARNRSLLKPCSEILMMIGGIAVLAVGSTWVLQGEMSLAVFLSFFGALAMCYNPVRGMLSSFGELAEFVPSAERAFELLDTKPKILDAPDAVDCPPLHQEIVFEKVTLDYGRGPVFRDLDLRIKLGERIGIVGRTGIGKSTLLSLLLRFYDPTEGRILIDGADIRNVKLGSLRRQMALVTQDPFLFHTTIEENIRYGKPGATIDEIVAVAKAAAIHDEIQQQPDGYKTVVGERGVTLSGGQRQRISVARAILRNAPILLLDEATSALDSSVEKQVQDALDRLSRGRTTLVVAHRMSTIRTADRIVVFSDEGGIEAVAPHDVLLETSATYRRLWERQSGQSAESVAAEHETRRDGELPRRAAE